MSDFARILAVCRAQVTTIPTIRMGVIECKLPIGIVGIVITRARHTAKNRAKKGYFTRYRVLKGCDKDKTLRDSLCADSTVCPSQRYISQNKQVSLGTSLRCDNNCAGAGEILRRGCY
jgi:hypothetical protein